MLTLFPEQPEIILNNVCIYTKILVPTFLFIKTSTKSLGSIKGAEIM